MSMDLISKSTRNKKSSFLNAFVNGSLFSEKNFPVNKNSAVHGMTMVSFFDLTTTSFTHSMLILWLCCRCWCCWIAFSDNSGTVGLSGESLLFVVDVANSIDLDDVTVAVILFVWYQTFCVKSMVPSTRLMVWNEIVRLASGAKLPMSIWKLDRSFCFVFDRSDTMKTEMMRKWLNVRSWIRLCCVVLCTSTTHLCFVMQLERLY